MEDLTRDDVIKFILYNSDNTEMMDKINKISYPFTSRYDNVENKKSSKSATMKEFEDTIERLKEKYD